MAGSTISGPSPAVRARWLFWSYSDERTNTGGLIGGDRGADDMSIGFKIALTPQECIWPEMAVIVQSTVPTGNGPGTVDNQMLPGIVWLWEIWGEAPLGGWIGPLSEDGAVPVWPFAPDPLRAPSHKGNLSLEGVVDRWHVQHPFPELPRDDALCNWR